ncbi:uncharacterized protein ACB058_019720 [Synchiropus picturatus]
MTAASPVCSPASSHYSQSSCLCLPGCHRHLRKGGALRSNLHLRSAPGVWLLLGVGVVLVGMTVAVAGYISAAPKPAVGRGSSHIERMKLAGPVVMGVGLFIFICAATLLYENRDRENIRLESLDDLEDLKGGLSWEDSPEQEQWECKEGHQGSWASPVHTLPLTKTDPPAPQKSRHPISKLLLEGKQEVYRKQEGDEKKKQEGRSTLLARVLHHQEPTPYSSSSCPSISHTSICSDSCNSSELNFNIRTGSPLMPEVLVAAASRQL